jgi:hypothetical protein
MVLPMITAPRLISADTNGHHHVYSRHAQGGFAWIEYDMSLMGVNGGGGASGCERHRQEMTE